MRNFIRELFWLFIEVIFVTFWFIDFFFLWPIFVILKNIRIEIFGPRLCKRLVKFSEKNWLEEHPNWPEELKFHGITLFSDGAAWEYKDGKWQQRPKRIGLTTAGAKVLPDGTLLHYEEWTNEKGERERREYQLPS